MNVWGDDMKNVNYEGKSYVFDIKKFSMTFARLRKKADMTQSELADQLNLSRQAISRYENGDSFPDISILLSICEVFDVSMDDLIGIKTSGEKEIVKQVAEGKDIQLTNASNIDDLIRLAPILKPSILENAVRGFKKEGINIESIANLVGYINDDSLYQLLSFADFTAPSNDVLKVLLPHMDDESKWKIFEKILEGKVDYHFLEEFIPACKWIDISLIEAAVIEGILDVDALHIMHEGAKKRFMQNQQSILRF